MFYMCAVHMNLWHVTLVSKIKSRVLPSIDELLEYIQTNEIDYVILTLPQNPSGEVYNENEFGKLIEVLNSRKVDLIIDICQIDEFNDKNPYVNYNLIAYPDVEIHRSSPNKSEYHTFFYENKVGKNLGERILGFANRLDDNKSIEIIHTFYGKAYTNKNIITGDMMEID